MRCLLLVLAIVLLSGVATAAPLPPDLIGALSRLTAAHGFSGQFKQTIRFSDGTMQTYQGEMAVLQPGRFRWHYIKPYEQLFVSDGHVIWHYEPDLRQVQILKRVQGVDPVVMRLLDGSMSLHDVYLLKMEHGAASDMRRYYVRIGKEKEVWLGLSNKQESDLESKQVPFLAYVESVDVLGNHNRIRLLHVTQQPPVPAEFVFKIPDGVDVLPLK